MINTAIVYNNHAGFHLEFLVWGVQRSVKHAKFLTSHMPIFEYQSPMHEKI